MKNNNTIINNNNYNNKNISMIKLHPYFITGLVEAEGCFSVDVNKNKNAKFGRNASLTFRIHMLNNEVELLHMVKFFFNCGRVWSSKDGFVTFIVSDISSIKNIIIPHFIKYPLRGTKYLDFLSFKDAFYIMESKEHLLAEGLLKLYLIRKSMNSYRKFLLDTYYSPKHTVLDNSEFTPIHGQYVNGFIAGDGCIGLHLSEKNFGRMYLSITQHINNKNLLGKIVDYFEKPLKIYKKGDKCLQITFTSIEVWDNIIFKHFIKYPLYGNKKPRLNKLITIRRLTLGNKHLIKVGKYKQWNPNYKLRIIEIWKS